MQDGGKTHSQDADLESSRMQPAQMRIPHLAFFVELGPFLSRDLPKERRRCEGSDELGICGLAVPDANERVPGV